LFFQVKEGRLDTCLEEHILPQLIEAGIFSVLRFSLDDNIPMVIQAAAQALASLLSSQPDEVNIPIFFSLKFQSTLFSVNQENFLDLIHYKNNIEA
jgi:HEAT repeat protein